MALSFALVAAFILAGALLLVGQRMGYSRIDVSENAVLFIAEAGINDELDFVNRNITNPTPTLRSTPPGVRSGQRFSGRRGSVAGAEGDFWVFTSADREGTVAWDGRNPIYYVHSIGQVDGITRQVRINGTLPGAGTVSADRSGPVPTSIQGPFGFFSVFGINEKQGSNPCLNIPGSAVVNVTGVVGVNGRISQSGTLNFTSGQNFGTAYQAIGTQLTGSGVSGRAHVLNWLSVDEVARRAFGLGSTVNPWDHLAVAGNNDNGRVRMFAPTGSSLSTTGTVSARFSSSGQTVLTNSNYSKNDLMLPSGTSRGRLGSFEGVTAVNGVRTLIFPPGDYLISDLSLDNLAETRVIIDFGGLTVGGNPTYRPIRFWMNGGSNNDLLRLPLSMTVPGGTGISSTGSAMGFRIFYNKASVFNLERDTSSTGVHRAFGAIYSVTPDGRTSIDIKGGGSFGTRLELRGAVVADQVSFNGYTTIIGATADNFVTNPNDPIMGVQYATAYTAR
jgi:hypothetical protein